MPRSVTTTDGPLPSQPCSRRMRAAWAAPPRLPGLVDELEVGRHGALREIDRDVRQPHADEADVLTRELACRGDDHHLGARECRLRGRGWRVRHQAYCP